MGVPRIEPLGDKWSDLHFCKLLLLLLTSSWRKFFSLPSHLCQSQFEEDLAGLAALEEGSRGDSMLGSGSKAQVSTNFSK